MSVERIPVLTPVRRRIFPVNDIEYYYDSHSTEEDLMGENNVHVVAIQRLFDLLRYLFLVEDWFIPRNLNLYTRRRPKDKPTTPDVALFKNVVYSQLPKSIPSWIVGEWNPYTNGQKIAPTVVVEVASKRTWREDVEDKPEKYARMGVKEYYFFCPVDAPVPAEAKLKPLRSWKNEEGRPIERTEEADRHVRGWIWSEELGSYLAPEGNYLELYDRQGHKRVTAKEAAEKAAAEEREAKEREREAMEQLLAKLRARGIDPDSL